jgi:drug/metabolite transporter (DMT)-like permease
MFSIVWLGEQLTWYQAGGIAAILTGLVLLSRPEQDAKTIP